MFVKTEQEVDVLQDVVVSVAGVALDDEGKPYAFTRVLRFEVERDRLDEWLINMMESAAHYEILAGRTTQEADN